MKNLLKVTLAAALIGVSFASSASAADEYNTVPDGNKQYAQCLTYSATVYEGGDAASPISGQSKAEAWCTCMWNETPDDFRGNLAKFSESTKGKAMNKLCEKYANWH